LLATFTRKLLVGPDSLCGVATRGT